MLYRGGLAVFAVHAALTTATHGLELGLNVLKLVSCLVLLGTLPESIRLRHVSYTHLDDLDKKCRDKKAFKDLSAQMDKLIAEFAERFSDKPQAQKKAS